jgi:hypothetical protein
MKGFGSALVLAAGLAAAPAGAIDLMKGRSELPELVLGDDAGNDYAVPLRDVELEAGKAYRLNITAKGQKEYKFLASEFFRNIWINQIVVNHLEIHMAGAPHHLEFDDQGTIGVDFVAIRPGTYPWSIEGLESRGMTGRLLVK